MKPFFGALVPLAWLWKKMTGIQLASFEGLLSLGGLTTLVFGASFVLGSIEEKEPEAARVGSTLFGVVGLGLLLLAGLINGGRERA